MAKFLNSFKDEVASRFKSFRKFISEASTPTALSSQAAGSAAVSVPSSPISASSNSVEPLETREQSPTVVGPASSDSDSNKGEVQAESNKSAEYKLSLGEVDDLLGAIYDALEIQEEEAQLSRHDMMYQGLGKKKARVFPVH